MAIGKTKERKKERKLTHAIKKSIGKKNKATRDDGVISLTPEIGEKLSVLGLAKLDSVVLRGDLFPLGVFLTVAMLSNEQSLRSNREQMRRGGGREMMERLVKREKRKRKDSVSGIGIPSSGRRRRRRRRQAEDQGGLEVRWQERTEDMD